MRIKRIICLLLIALLTISMAACGKDSPAKPNLNNTQTQGTQPSEGDDTPDAPEQPEIVMPDVPTEGLQLMEYNAAYDTLTDVSESIGNSIVGIPSTQVPTMNSVTEFTTQDQLQSFVTQFADVGYTGDIVATIDANGFKFVRYWTSELAGNNRYFFLANAEYSAHKPIKILKTMYDANTDSLYVMLGYKYDFYGDYEPAESHTDDIAINAKASYHIAALNLESFAENVEHIVFVNPEPMSLCREDINVSVVPFDEKYKSYDFFDLEDGGIAINSYSFPSSKAPTQNGTKFITSKDSFLELQNEYNDIVNREEDTLIFESGLIEHTHRAGGLQNATNSDSPLMNILISSPELDPYSYVSGITFWVEPENAPKRLCGRFYDPDTKTAYVYLGYTGVSHSQYEDYTDEQPIQENSKATHVMMSISFHEDCLDIVENIVIVLPNPTTIPSN